MEKNTRNDTFNYTYNAKQQEEINNIRKKYLPHEEDKFELLRKLDNGVTAKASAVSIAFGIVGALIMGVGMCCCMVWADRLFVPGIFIGGAGIAAVSAAYPLYRRICKKERERIAPEVLRITDELMK